MGTTYLEVVVRKTVFLSRTAANVAIVLRLNSSPGQFAVSTFTTLRILPLPGRGWPRIPISYFPDLCGALLDADPTLDVFSGIAECMSPYDSIDDINTFPLPCPSCHSSPAPAQTQMTRLPFCWRLTCSRGQHSLQLLPLPRSDYTLRTPNSRTSSCTWSRGL